MAEQTGRCHRRGTRHRVALALAAGTTAAEALVVAARRHSLFAMDTVVRCRDGHLFTTFWIPGASLKALRLGWWRFQRCPVGPHWSLVTPVDSWSLTDDDLAVAAGRHDARVP